MALSTGDEQPSEVRQWVHDSLAALGQKLAGGRGPMQGKKYVTKEQWFDGHRTVLVGEEVTLPDHVAKRLTEGGYVIPLDVVATKEDEPIGPPEVATEPQNRVVSTQGTAGPKGKK